MKILDNISLKNYNTFGVDAKARKFCAVNSPDDVRELISSGMLSEKYYILGGGANILFTRDFDGLIIKSGMMDIRPVFRVGHDDEFAIVEAGSGVVWHNFLKYLLRNSLFGGENLAKIPGTVGAAPVQNIGAYGAEQKDIFDSLDAIDLKTGDLRTFRGDECKFAYRFSIFKTPDYANRFFILNVRYKLFRTPKVNCEYADIRRKMQADGTENPTPEYIFEAISAIRDQKLPDPKIFGNGNAGSFFKNPVVTKEKFSQLTAKFGEIPSYPAPNDMIKIPAAFLIERTGYKGKRQGDVGVSPKHALILQNFGNAGGKEIYDFSEEIIEQVYALFSIKLEREVIII